MRMTTTTTTSMLLALVGSSCCKRSTALITRPYNTQRIPFHRLSKNDDSPSFAPSLIRLQSTATDDDDKKKKKKKGPKFNKKRNRHLLRADRVLSNRGWGSRSECTRLLKQKRVSIQSDDNDDTKTIVQGPSEKLTLNVPLFVDDVPVPTIPLLLA
jgi:hypothetical protein